MIRQAVVLGLSMVLQTLPVYGVESGIARDGKEWLQPSLFVNLSWDDVHTACPPREGLQGVECSGMLGTVDVTGYRWASIQDMFDLLRGYGVGVEPGVFFGEEAGSAWAPEILGDFHPTGSDSGSEYVAVWIPGPQGEVAELTNVFDPEGIDSFEIYGTAGTPSDDVGALLWRDLSPRPVVGGISVTPTGNGRYNVFGSVTVPYGGDACALAMASGRCVFTCGPGSLRCEGGSAELPKGSFALFDLVTETDGSIILQAFVHGLVAHSVQLDPSQFGTSPLPAPDVEPFTYTGSYVEGNTSVSSCFNLSADATRLETTGSECAGGSSLAFEAEIDALYPLNDPGCDASISISLSQDIPVNQGFSVTSDDGVRVTGYFLSNFPGVGGTVQDANGCRAEWTAIREDFNP
jgi:hypothetical protein